MAEELIADAIKYEKFKNTTSSCIAWAVSNKLLLDFLKDIYMHLCFKFSALINISLLCSNWKLYMSTVST
jgi:hypothetical protein